MEKIILSALIGIGLYLTLTSSDSCSSKTKVEKLINDKVKPNESTYGQAQFGGQTFSNEIIGWIENSRFNSGNVISNKTYPPCFKLSKEGQEIYDILESKNLIATHKVLLEVISMILCQYKFLASKMCVDTMIEDRIRDMDALGYKRYDNRYRPKLLKLVGKYYETASQSSLEFLLRGLTLMEDELTKLSYKVNETELDQIKNLISRFNSQFFVLVAKDCT